MHPYNLPFQGPRSTYQIRRIRIKLPQMSIFFKAAINYRRTVEPGALHRRSSLHISHLGRLALDVRRR
jgi:hypothetical protein